MTHAIEFQSNTTVYRGPNMATVKPGTVIVSWGDDSIGWLATWWDVNSESQHWESLSDIALLLDDEAAFDAAKGIDLILDARDHVVRLAKARSGLMTVVFADALEWKNTRSSAARHLMCGTPKVLNVIAVPNVDNIGRRGSMEWPTRRNQTCAVEWTDNKWVASWHEARTNADSRVDLADTYRGIILVESRDLSDKQARVFDELSRVDGNRDVIAKIASALSACEDVTFESASGRPST